MRALLGGRDLGKYGSQGQHRLAALALKLGSAELLESGREDPPILLLDDFGSELDERRREAVLCEPGRRLQIFITATDRSGFGSEVLFGDVRRMRRGAWVKE